MIPAFKIFENLINYESNIEFKNEKSITINKNQEKKAKKLDPQKFKQIDKNNYEYKHKNGKISHTNLLNKSCSCRYYIDKCICYHLIFVAIQEKVALPGMEVYNKFSLKRRKKSDKKKQNLTEFDDEDSDFDIDVDEEAADVGDAEKVIQNDNTAKQVDVNILGTVIINVPKRMGRPPKVPTALETDDKIKQPNKRKNSVNKEHDENKLRRSARNKNKKNLMNY